MKSETHTLWIGLDVGKKTFTAAFDLQEFCKNNIGVGYLPVKDSKNNPKGVEALALWMSKMRMFYAEKFECYKKFDIRVLMETTGHYSRMLSKMICDKYPQLNPVIESSSVIHSYKKSLKLLHETDQFDAKAIARYGTERQPENITVQPRHYIELQELTRERDALVEVRTKLENRQESIFNSKVKKINTHAIGNLTHQINRLEKEIKKHVETHKDIMNMD